MPCDILDIETDLASQVASRWVTYPAWSPDRITITFGLRLSTAAIIWMIDAEVTKKLRTFKLIFVGSGSVVTMIVLFRRGSRRTTKSLSCDGNTVCDLSNARVETLRGNFLQ